MIIVLEYSLSKLLLFEDSIFHVTIIWPPSDLSSDGTFAQMIVRFTV